MRTTMLSTKAVIFFFVILILIIGFVFVQQENEEDLKPMETIGVSLEEKQQIEDWLQENNLNEYGDAIDTAYTGGTPLFDERTGESTDRYEYILRGHPDRPWKK